MCNIPPKDGDLRVWWIPQVPGPPFYVHIQTVDDAVLLLKALANYDHFQYENNIKGDYSNAGGLQKFEDNDWNDWYNSEGEDIDEVMNKG